MAIKILLCIYWSKYSSVSWKPKEVKIEMTVLNTEYALRVVFDPYIKTNATNES